MHAARLALTLAALLASGGAAAGTGTGPQSTEGLYQLHCSGCHGPDGSGMPPQIPNLRESLPRLLTSAEGRDYMLRVPGVARATVPEQDLARILNWLGSELTPAGTPVTSFTVENIRRARQNPLSDPFTVRRQLLLPEDDY